MPPLAPLLVLVCTHVLASCDACWHMWRAPTCWCTPCRASKGSGVCSRATDTGAPMRIRLRAHTLTRAYAYARTRAHAHMHARTGYQYPPRLKHFLRVILLAAAGYSRSLEEHSDDNIYRQLGMAYLHGIKFLMKPVKKSERLTQQFAEADVKFVKVCGSVVRRVQTLSVPVGKGGGHTDPGALANLSVLVNPRPLCPSLLLVPCLTSLSLPNLSVLAPPFPPFISFPRVPSPSGT